MFHKTNTKRRPGYNILSELNTCGVLMVLIDCLKYVGMYIVFLIMLMLIGMDLYMATANTISIMCNMCACSYVSFV